VANATPRANPSASASVSVDGARRMTYIVRRGDTLYGIARLLQVTVSDLAGWNGVSGAHNLKPGQTLVAFVKSRT
jgi:membrane-bound lytic murein transglycosylase D